jgi:hypothetical protein
MEADPREILRSVAARPEERDAKEKSAATPTQNDAELSLDAEPPGAFGDSPAKTAPFINAGCKYSPHPKNEGCGTRERNPSGRVSVRVAFGEAGADFLLGGDVARCASCAS